MSDWSSDVCSSVLRAHQRHARPEVGTCRRIRECWQAVAGGDSTRCPLYHGQLPRDAVGACTGRTIGGHQGGRLAGRSEEHTSELQSLMRISYAVFCLKKKKTTKINNTT